MRLSGKTAIVTGGARGIGAGIAECLVEDGARVALLDLDGAGAVATAAELGEQHLGVTADAADEESMRAATAEVVEAFGGLDILVNNAGAGRGDENPVDALPVPPFTNVEVSSWDSQLANNLRTTMIGAKTAIPHLEERGGGAIVNIASIAGLMATPNLPAYGAAKAGVIHLTRSLARELAPRAIRVNAICPGLVWTGAWQALAELMRERLPGMAELDARQIFLSVVAQQVPMGVEQTPEEMGRLAAFLVSEEAATITGQAIAVDGGITLGPALA